jgi:hypothetical protein
MVDPSSLAEFRERELASLVSWAIHRDAMRRARRQGGGSFGWSSDGVLRAEELEQHGDVPLRGFPGAPTLRELAALPADAFGARFLAACRRGPATYHVFGHVPEGDDLAHVVYRDEGPGGRYMDSIHVDVLHARRLDGRWFVQLNRDVADGTWIMLRLDELDGREGPDELGDEPEP